MTAEKQNGNIIWKNEEHTFTLTGEPVLELSLSWPEIEGKGMNGPRRYYERLYRQWKEHWRREGYWQACADLALQREQSRPFRVWKTELSGQVMPCREEYLSITMLVRELRGDGRILEYRWGDTWRWKDGGTVTLKDLYGYKKGWRKQLEVELLRAAQECRKNGICLDEQIKHPLHCAESFALGEREMIFYFPQCTIAPAVEGAVTLGVPLPEGLCREEKEKEA